MLSKDDLILPKVLFGRVALELLHSELVLEKLLSCRFQSLLLDRAWHVALFKDASRNKDIVVDFVINLISEHTLLLISREQEAIEVVLILPSILICGKCDRLVDIQHGSLADLRGLILGQITESVDGLLLAGVAVGLIVRLLKLLNVRDKLGLAHRLDERGRLRRR